MNSNQLSKLVIAALMAAMTYIATMLFKFPLPLTGYIHLGDGFVLLSGIILGPIYGGAAAGIGSMFADLSLGYAPYAPATFIIKALAAIAGGFLYQKLRGSKLGLNATLLPVISAGVCGGIIVTVGYFLYDCFVLQYGVAASVGILPNIVQNIFGIIISTALLPILVKTPIVRDFMFQRKITS